jgi:hypothetical protein
VREWLDGDEREVATALELLNTTPDRARAGPVTSG